MPNGNPIVAVDAMGGDFGPSVVVPGAVDAARRSGCRLVLVGRQAEIDAELAKLPTGGLDIRIVHAPDVAGMDEKPSDILRRKKDCSIQVACRLVKNGEAHGVVSAGNSGATGACAMFILGRIKGVERPGLAGFMPTEKHPMVLIDVGANVDCRPLHLFQFGVMAEVLARDLLEIKTPRVGLLSIGEEEGKGNAQVKGAFELFKRASFNFVGNVEGRDIFTGDVDVVVCDGFVGNVALKLSEGLAYSLGRLLKRELQRGIVARLGTMLALGALKRFAKVVDYAEYGGAPLLGLQGVAFVCHGASNRKAMDSAVGMAAKFIEKKTNEHLIEQLGANEELTRFAKASGDH
ncbi:MAG: phosphate acyltransferase PlsX [Desulfovibrionaceae bacterium]